MNTRRASQYASEMHQLLIYSGIALAMTAAISVVPGWITAGRVLRPLRTTPCGLPSLPGHCLIRRPISGIESQRAIATKQRGASL